MHKIEIEVVQCKRLGNAVLITVNDFGIWNLQAIRASTYENFTGTNTYSLVRK